MKFYISWDAINKEITMPIKAQYIWEAVAVFKDIVANDTLERDFRLIMINKNGLPILIG